MLSDGTEVINCSAYSSHMVWTNLSSSFPSSHSGATQWMVEGSTENLLLTTASFGTCGKVNVTDNKLPVLL